MKNNTKKIWHDKSEELEDGQPPSRQVETQIKQRIYLIGPMKGYPKSNFPEFHRIASKLRGMGFDIISPAEINVRPKSDYRSEEEFYNACLRADIKALVGCDAIALMKGWEESKGAHLELHIAHRVGISILHIDDILAG